MVLCAKKAGMNPGDIGALLAGDFTANSGWMYSINGTLFPGKGLSAYNLSDGDVLYIRYTVAEGKDIGGSGGGKPDSAMGGGKDATKVDDALALVLSKNLHIDISRAYLFTDMTVLLLSLSYIPVSRILYSLFTVVLSGQIIGWIQKIPLKTKKT